MMLPPKMRQRRMTAQARNQSTVISRATRRPQIPTPWGRSGSPRQKPGYLMLMSLRDSVFSEHAGRSLSMPREFEFIVLAEEFQDVR